MTYTVIQSTPNLFIADVDVSVADGAGPLLIPHGMTGGAPLINWLTVLSGLGATVSNADSTAINITADATNLTLILVAGSGATFIQSTIRIFAMRPHSIIG